MSLSSMTDGAETAAALQKYSAFVDEVLRPQLQQTLARRDAIAREATECAELRELLSELLSRKDSSQPLHTLMDVGERFRVRAKVVDTTMITVDVGLNFHVEMTLSEAMAFVTSHLQYLTEYVLYLSCCHPCLGRRSLTDNVAMTGSGARGSRRRARCPSMSTWYWTRSRSSPSSSEPAYCTLF